MFNRHLFSQARIAEAPAEGWAEYQHALDLITQANWPNALTALAAAETLFHSADDAQGLWRALLGQALLHWHDGMAALALARAAAALRAAEDSDDGFAVGCVAWQIANMMLDEGEYQRAAEYLDQTQLALDAVGMAPPGGTLAAAAQLCNEIVRWKQRHERQQINRRDAETAIAEIQHDLIKRLNQAARSLRIVPFLPASLDGSELLALLPAVPATLNLPDGVAPQASLRAWLRRLWRRLVYGDDLTQVEPLTHAAAPELPAGLALVQRAEPAAHTPARPFSGATVVLADEAAPASPETAPLDLPTPADEPDTIELVAAAEPEPAPRAAEAVQPEPEVLETSDPERPAPALPSLHVQLLGTFRVAINGQPIESWPSGRGRAVFKYLLAHHDRAIPRELLMEMFWPDATAESARNSLNVALYGLRQAFRAATAVNIVQFNDSAYRLAPELQVELDVDLFRRVVQAGRRAEDAGDGAAAMAAYQQASALYGGDFMADDLADDWPVVRREQLRDAYLDTLDRLGQLHFAHEQYERCVTLCLQLLTHDACREDAHCRLMRCYSRLGQHHLALRQYQSCAEALQKELGVDPDDTTRQLYERVRRRDTV